MAKILLVGAGQIGSRHLQALKGVNQQLDIFVVDSSKVSLDTAKLRYDSMPTGKFEHDINYSGGMPAGNFDIVFITTSSDNRADVARKILNVNKVKNIIFEKWLFHKKSDYANIDGLLKKNKVHAWVNCSMRMMPFYKTVAPKFKNKRLGYSVTGSNFGLATNLIHYVDHAISMNSSIGFRLDTTSLDKKIIPSKRKGFLELTGTAVVHFDDGSICSVASFPDGNAPIIVEFHNDTAHCFYRESEGKALMAEAGKQWQWQEYDAPVPYQSQLTTDLVNSILNTGKCGLVSYGDSMKIHLQLIDPLLKFVNQNSRKKYNHFPFT